MDKNTAALMGRIGAHRTHATHDSREITQRARDKFLDNFLVEVDPEGILTPEERQRRAEHARKAYFAKLAFISARVRRARKEGAGHAA